MNNRGKQMLLACAVPVLILLGMCVLPVYTLLNGQDIILQTKPFDPSDIYRGDYVSLRYEAETVPKNLLEEPVQKAVENGESNFKVFVILKKENEIYIPAKVTLDKPGQGVYLKGNLSFMTQNENQEETAFIEYSLDKYFVPDNSGVTWEQAVPHQSLLAKVKVSNGYAVLTGLEKKK